MKENQGNLARVGMPRLLHLIYNKGDSAAVLDIVREPIKKRFFFQNGRPVFATSNILNEVLGRLLMQEGVITQKDYETSLEVVLKEKKKHGQVLISMGLISPDDLETFLALQLKKRLWKLFSWNEGTYRYTKTETLPGAITRFPLHPATLILEGINLGFYPASRIKADLKDYLDKPVSRAEDFGRYGLEDFRLNLQEKRFLDSFNGSKTLREALEGSDLLRHRALSLTLAFLMTGLLTAGAEPPREEEFFQEEIKEAEVMEPATDSRLNAELLFMRAKSALSRKDFVSAIETLKDITDINPAEGEYWAYLGWAIYNENPLNIKEAEKILKDSIDLNNDLDSAWYFLGVIFLASGKIDWAEKSFHAAISKNPWLLEALSELKRLEIKKSLKPAQDRAQRKKYMEVFGFREDPFTGAPEEKYLITSGGQSVAMDSLVKSIKKRSGPLLVEGGEGAGKTTIALELLKRLSNEKILCTLVLKPQEKELQLIKAINSEVGSPSDSPSIKEQLLNLGMRVSQNKIQGGHTVLMIDDAHLLNDGCLKLIQYLSRLKTMQILLFAGPELSGRLKGPDFKELDQKLASVISVGPLTAEETGAYVSKRLEAAERSAPEAGLFPGFSVRSGAQRILHEETGGVPASLNIKSSLVLEKAALLRSTLLDEALVNQVFGRAASGPEQTEGTGEIKGPVEDMTHEALEPLEADLPAPEAAGASVEKGEAEAPAQVSLPQMPDEPAAPAAMHREGAPQGYINTEAAVKKRKIGIFTLIGIVVLMLVAGLIAGSLIGTFWSGRKAALREEASPPVAAPLPAKDIKNGTNDISAAIDSSAGLTGTGLTGGADVNRERKE